MTISELTLKSSGGEEPVRRFEVFTGAGRRQDWSAEDKARIVAESYEPGESVGAVARRHALSPQQLFSWRRRLRRPANGEASSGTSPLFCACTRTSSAGAIIRSSATAKAARAAGPRGGDRDRCGRHHGEDQRRRLAGNDCRCHRSLEG